MDTILFKLEKALFFSFLVVYVTNILLITQSCLSVVQASSYFKCLNMHMTMYATPTFITECSVLLLMYRCTVVLNDCKNEAMAYTVPKPENWLCTHASV